MSLYCEHPKSSTNCFEVTIKSQQPQSPPLLCEAWKVDLPSSHSLSLSLAASPQTPPQFRGLGCFQRATTPFCCRSRLADFFTNCQPESRSASSCLKENYADCLLAYSGLIGKTWERDGRGTGESGLQICLLQPVMSVQETTSKEPLY